MQSTRTSLPANGFVLVLVSVSIVIYPLASYPAPSFPENFALTNIDVEMTEIKVEPPTGIDTSKLDPLLEEIEYAAYDIANRYDSGRYLFQELLESLDFDPEKAFLFVRDHIGFEPYSGVLRDAEGALGAQAGNAYDKSLLLHRLLQDMGVESRLAFGTLDDESARRLYAQSLVSKGSKDELLPLSNLVGFSSEIIDRMLYRANRDFNWISAASNKPGHSSKSTVVTHDVVKDHVWIQARIDSEWEDLDSSFADAERDDVFAKAQRFAKKAEEADRHTVLIKVVSETLEKGKIVERVLLEYEMSATKASESRTYLTFAPRNPTIGGQLATAMGAEIGFIPMLSVDGDPKSGKVIPGIVSELTEGKSFFYGTERTELSGLFVDVRAGVSRTPRSGSRAVLIDRIPSALRRSGKVDIDDDDLLPLPMDGKHPIAFKGIHQILVSNGGSNPRLAAEGVGLAAYFVGKHLLAPGAVDELPMDSVFWPAAMIRSAQLAVNERLLEAALNDTAALRFFIGEPRVYMMSLQVPSASVAEGARYGMTVDLLHDPIYAASGMDVEPFLVYQRRVWHGVIQASFETTLVELVSAVSGSGNSRVTSASTESRGKPLVFSDARDERLPETAPNALIADLEENKSVVVSAAATRNGIKGWWSIAQDGTTRAMLLPQSGGATIVTWWHDYAALSSRLPKPYAGNPTVHYVNPEALDQYAKTVSKANKATRETATRRLSANNKLPRTSRGGGGTEYGIVLNISIFSTLGVAGILALTLCALSIIGMLYIIAHTMHLERQRKERGY